MEKIRDYANHFIFFKPTGKVVSINQLKEIHDEFYHGELTEEFVKHCANESMHAFWINYKDRNQKIQKEKFCEKFKKFVNEMLKEESYE